MTTQTQPQFANSALPRPVIAPPKPRLPEQTEQEKMADSLKIVSYEQFMEHQQRENLWILLHGKVYDVAKFLDEHPGGEEVIVAEAGKDATESFEDVGHSDEARDLLKGMFVGTFDGGDKLKSAPAPVAAKATHNTVASGGSPSPIAFLIPLACLGAYFAYRFYGQ